MRTIRQALTTLVFRTVHWLPPLIAAAVVIGLLMPFCWPIGMAVAQGSEHSISEGLYISLGWLTVGILGGIFWLWVILWIDHDAEYVGANRKLWNTITFASGVALFLLTINTSPTIGVVSVGLLVALLFTYMSIRDTWVPAPERLLSKYGMMKAYAKIAARFGVLVEVQYRAKSEQDEIRIELFRTDGTSTSALMGDNTDVERSRALLAGRQILQDAVRLRATDVHLEPKASEMQVRLRIDGILHPAKPFTVELGGRVVSSLKVLADMNVAEKRRPQDGNFSGLLDDKEIDFRAQTQSSAYGEKMAIRVLDKDTTILTLAHLGMQPKTLEQIESVLEKPNGMIVVCGPTGSGKTSTVYASMRHIDAFQKNIVTIENPIEYRLDNVTQTAINPKAGITFSSTLTSVLRQDPDVILVGEIRDGETAQVSMQSAMTGHLIITTLHANDTVTAILRLMDLGVEPYLVSSALTCVLSQRLIRLLCNECKAPYKPQAQSLKKLGLPPEKIEVMYKAKGCPECQNTGYHGRTGIFEFLPISDAFRALIRQRPGSDQLAAAAKKAGLRTLQQDGLIKAARGATSLQEVIRVTK